MSGGFFTSAFPDDYQPPDIDTSVAHQARAVMAAPSCPAACQRRETA